MKKSVLLIILLLGITASAYTQTIVFTYDDAGNRTSREMQPGSTLRSAAADSVASGLLAGYNIKVYPNPTYGQVTIEIDNFEIETPLNVVVFDQNNLPVQQKTMKASSIQLDFSTYPSAAWYIIAFILNDERRDFKIIKL